MMARRRPLPVIFAAFAAAGVLVAATGWAGSPCDASMGAQVFSDKCATCHTVVPGQQGAVGPAC